MPVEVLGLDHVYVAVSDLTRSTAFYDGMMELLGFRKGTDPVGGQAHTHYFNRVLQYTLRPARPGAPSHDPLVPGLHHLCFQVRDKLAVDQAAEGLRALGVEVTSPRIYPDYGPDYYAIYLHDPDGIELEIVSRTRTRNIINDHWDELKAFENPLSEAGLI